MKKPTFKNYYSFFWTIIILILCSFPGNAIPEFQWLEMLAFDKWVHASVFFILGIAYTNTLMSQRKIVLLNRFPKVFALLFSISYGLLLEFLQYKVFFQRSGDWADVLANSIGAAFAFVFFEKLNFFLLEKQA